MFVLPHAGLPSDFRHPDDNKRAVVLEPVKDQGPCGVALLYARAILDCFCARRLYAIVGRGAKKRLARSNKETLREEKMDNPLDKNRPIQGFRTPAGPANHTRQQQAFEKRQWTKSREWSAYRAAGPTRV